MPPGAFQMISGGNTEEPDAPGGLSLIGGGEDPFESAITGLRVRARELNPDAIDQFAQRANGAFPTWKEIQARVEQELENKRREGERTLQELQHPPINRGQPWLNFAAGMMQPTKTGAFGESLGYGMSGLAKGYENINKEELDFARRAAETRYGIAKDRTTDVMGLEKMGLSAEQLEMALSLMRQRMGTQMMTPAIKEWAMVNNIPVEDVLSGRIPPDKRADLERFINLARGSTQMKNAQTMLDPRNPDFANTVRLLANQPLVSKLMQLAEAHHPMSAYQGQDVSVRNNAVQGEFWNLVRQNSIGATGGAQLPVAGEAANLQRPPGIPPIATPAAAAPGPSAPAAPAAPAAEAPHPFDEYMTAPKFQPNVPGQIQSEQTEAAQKAAATKGEERASKYIESEVYPGLKAADDMRSSAIIARQLLDKDPKLTGALKPFAGEVANFMTTLGVAPTRVQQFATNMELFRSQAMLQVLAKQLEQKGVQTESDALRIMQAGIDPKKPAEANRFMVHYMEAVANRLQERAAFFDRWSKKNGTLMNGSVEAWNGYSKKFPMAMVVDGKVHFRDVPLPGA